MTSTDSKVCPFCAETIKAAAIRCRYCQSDLPASGSTAPAPVPAQAPSPVASSPTPPQLEKDSGEKKACGRCKAMNSESAASCVSCGVALPYQAGSPANKKFSNTYNNEQNEIFDRLKARPRNTYYPATQSSASAQRLPNKSKPAAVILALLFGIFAWLYTSKADLVKFLVTLAITGVLFGIWVNAGIQVQPYLDECTFTEVLGCGTYHTTKFNFLLAYWAVTIWVVIDMVRRPRSFYDNYPNIL